MREQGPGPGRLSPLVHSGHLPLDLRDARNHAVDAAASARTALMGVHDYMSLADRLNKQDLVVEVLPRLHP
jgi:hypothetical protein